MFKKHWIKQEQAGEGEGGSGAGGSQGADIQALIAAAVEKEVKGLKENNAALKKEKETLAKRYEGMPDPEKVKSLMAQFEGSEEAKLAAEGKWDEIVNRRFAKRDEDVAKQLKDAQDAVEAAKISATRFNARLMQGEVRAAAPTDLHPSALELAQLLAERTFALDDEGNVVPRDGALGKDGKTPYSLREWYESLRSSHPTLFVNGNTGSSSYAGAGKGGSKTMSREKFDQTPLHLRGEIIASGIQIVDR